MLFRRTNGWPVVGPRNCILALGVFAMAVGACSGDSKSNASGGSGQGGSAGVGPQPGSGGSAGRGGSSGSSGASLGGSSGSSGASLGGSSGSSGASLGGSSGASLGGGGSDAGSAGSGEGGCAPTSCEDEGASCGPLSDGCGNMLDCGSCANGCSCGDDNTCEGATTSDEARRYGQRGRSSGFMGTDTQYYELYDIGACFSVNDCIDPCLQRGGTQEMCAAGECIHSLDDYCLPATIWQNLGSLSAEGDDPYTEAAELVLVGTPYHDTLLVNDFKLEVPAAAEIRGITVTVRRAAGGDDEAVDAAVRLVKGGVVTDADRSSPIPWNAPPFEDVDYGSATDLWNESWTPADVNAADFGVALRTAYTQTAGNGRAYVDIVYVTVSYDIACQ